MCSKRSKVTASKKPFMRNCGYNKIQLILLDYKLGDMFGDSIARKIKNYNGTKIILISAYDLDSELIRELEENRYLAEYIKN